VLAPVFDVRIESADVALRHDVASRLRGALQARGAASARVSTSEHVGEGIAASVRVRALHGATVWLSAGNMGNDAHDATIGALAFLERWGFIRASVVARSPRAAGAR